MSQSTREMIIQEAIGAFAEKGLYGTSLDNVATRVGLSKQALLHHFGSKRRLYAEVIDTLSTMFLQEIEVAQDNRHTAPERLRYVFSHLLAVTQREELATMLLVRELLDNHDRTQDVEHWSLKPFLLLLSDLVLAARSWPESRRIEALARVYAALGVINYFAISAPTLRHLFGETDFERWKIAQGEELIRVVEAD